MKSQSFLYPTPREKAPRDRSQLPIRERGKHPAVLRRRHRPTRGQAGGEGQAGVRVAAAW